MDHCLNFFLNAAAIAFSRYPTEGYIDAAHQLGILLFPVFISLNNTDFGKYKFQLLEIFGLSCTITILYLYFDALRTIHYFHLPWSSLLGRDFINHNFSAPIGLHATYLSMYAVLSMGIFFSFFPKPCLKKCELYFLRRYFVNGRHPAFVPFCFYIYGNYYNCPGSGLTATRENKIQFFNGINFSTLLIFLFITAY